jgi:tetratricopeptide (TPR) repeat protein
MKQNLFTVMGVALALFATDAVAQKHKLTDAWFALKNNDLNRAKNSIDEAYEHETTKGTSPMWYYRGTVYLTLAANNAENANNKEYKILDSEASYKSAESYFYYLSSSDKKKSSELAEVYESILYASSYASNDAANFYTNENYTEALRYFEIVYKLTLHDKNQKLKQNGITTNKMLLNMYYCANEMKDKNMSRKYLNMLIENKYEDPKLYIFLANSYFDENNPEKGLETIQKGREMYPTDKGLLTEEINFYLDKGETDILMSRFSEAIEAEPDNDNYYYFRGTLYHQRKSYEAAEKDYLKSIALNPSNIDAKYNLGAMYVEMAVPIINRMNDNIANFNLYEQLEVEKFKLYNKALPYLEESYESGQIEVKKDKENLLTILRDTYKFQKNRERMEYFQRELEAVRSGKK